MAVVEKEMEREKEGGANGRGRPNPSTRLGRQTRAVNIQRIDVPQQPSFFFSFHLSFVEPPRSITAFCFAISNPADALAIGYLISPLYSILIISLE
jgi:hypothetical protein